MKKLISILLVAMLIIGMFPATALTASAATEIVFNLGNNGSAAHKDGSAAQTYTETVGGYTLSITNGAKMYPASYDAKGNSCIKLGTSSVVGSFKFTVPSDVTGVKIEVAKYKANTSKINVNGTAYTLTKASNNGEYDAIEVSTLSNKTVSLTTVSGGVRAMVNTITFVIDSGTSCDHTLTETIPGVDPTCTEPGVEEAQSCVCGENKVGGAAIDPLGHEYADGACANCEKAMVEPGAPTATLLTQLPGIGDTVAIYYPVESLAMSVNASGSKLAPILAELQDGKMPYNNDVAQLTFGAEGEYYTFATADGKYLVTGATGGNLSFAEELSDTALWSITASGTNTWNITNKAAIYNSNAQAIEYYGGFTTYGISTSNPVYRMALYLIAESVCEHADKTSQEDGFDATCTEAGQEDSYVCDDCGANFPGATIDPLGHNYVNGVCSRCDEEEPAVGSAELSFANQTYRTSYSTTQAVYSNNGITFTNNKSSSTTNLRDNAGDDHIRLYKDSEAVIECASGLIAEMVFTCPSAEYANVLAESIGSEAVADETTVTVTLATPASTYTIAKMTAQTRANSVTVTYETSAASTPVVEMGGKEYTSFEEAYAEDPDTTIKLLAPIENINVTGDLYLDLNGFTASVDGANAIFAGDSSATTSKAGTGVLTTTANVETVETIGSTRYVALKGENNQYTFHALEMKLTAVSLRTSAAGVYYKAEMICDAELKAATACHGVVVSVDGMPGVDFATVTDKINAWTAIEGAPAEGNMTSCSVFGIFKDGKENNAERGEMKIYARAYLQLKDTNEIVMSSNSAAKSLKDVMEEVNGKFTTLEDADQKNLINFFKKWESAMVNWNVDNIADAADAAN